MAPNMIPYGLLAGGNYGVLFDTATDAPLAAVVEVLQVLPPTNSPDNFDGRTVFIVPKATAYIFSSTPIQTWIPLEGVPAQVGHVNGNPPVSPTPLTGSLYYDLDTLVLFLWDGSGWRAIGGQYASQIIENTYTGDGTTRLFPTGASIGLNAPYVEVFLNGVRQRSNPSGDYSVAGSNVSFNIAPPVSVKIFVRTLVPNPVNATTRVIVGRYVALPSQTAFSTNTAGSDPNRIFVFVNGSVKVQAVDYTVSEQNTIITTLVKINSTTARATTVAPHGMIIGQGIIINGTNQTYYNRPFIVTNIFSPTAFDFTVAVSAPASATGVPTMSFSPPAINDNIIFSTPMTGGENVDIRTFKNIIVGSGSGSGGTISIINVGSGAPLVLPPVGNSYRVKSLSAIAPFALLVTPTDLTIGLGPNFFAQTNIPTQWTKRVSGAPTIPILDGPTITWDMRLGNTFLLAIQSNRTIGTPLGVTDGDTGVLYIVQAGGGSHTITWGGIFQWSSGTPPSLSTANGARDMFSYNVRGGIIFMSFVGGAFA